jgi:hypothetical protein
VQVDWGKASMIVAERVLLSHALKDPLNERFVFISDRYSSDSFTSSVSEFNSRIHIRDV